MGTINESLIGATVDTIGSAIGAVTEGVQKLSTSSITTIGEVSSVFQDSLETFAPVSAGIGEAIGGVIGTTAEFLDPGTFFESTGNLFGEILTEPLTQIGSALADPALNFGDRITDFSDKVFGGGLIDSIESVISDIPLVRLPFEILADTFQMNASLMDSIFESFRTIDVAAPDYDSQFLNMRFQVGQLNLADLTISRISMRMQDYMERLILGKIDERKKEERDQLDDKEQRRRFNDPLGF